MQSEVELPWKELCIDLAVIFWYTNEVASY